MSNDDHQGMKKIQAWVKQDTWDKLVSLGYTSPTNAVTQGFKLLLETPYKTPSDTPEYSHELPELRAQIELLHLLIQEKDERIQDLKKENERLDFYAHYFKSLEYKRLETNTEDREIVIQAKEDKPAREPKRTTGKLVIKKICKECGKEFEARSSKAETCSNKCRQRFNRNKEK